MDLAGLVSILQEFAYILVTFAFFFCLGLWKGRYFLIKCIASFYISLLLVLQFPYFEQIASSLGSKVVLLKITLFLILTGAGIFMFRRHIPSDDYEKLFEGFAVKILLAVLATALVFAFAYNALDVSQLANPNSLLQYLFVDNNHFFWWLLFPLIVLSLL